jgi:hypothetical protein
MRNLLNIFKPSIVKYQRIILVVCGLYASSGIAQQEVGTVILSTGAVSALDVNGDVRVLAKGSVVFPGDRITTASKSLCVLKMIDDAKISIKQKSEIVIEEYQFAGAADDSSVMELVKGGFRTVTGLIGSNNPDAYKVKSDLAVLGIRGTNYGTNLCEPGSCVSVGGDETPPGQYTINYFGIVTVTTNSESCAAAGDQCTVTLRQGDTGFVNLDTNMILPENETPKLSDPAPDPEKVSETESSVKPATVGCEV